MIGVSARVYRATKGRVGGRMSGAPVLLLEHVGRKSGTKRTAPLLYLADGDDLVIVASRGGSDAAPGWLYNLRASPETTVQIRGERIPVRAREATAEERERLWPLAVAMYADYETYQQRTSRVIPLLVLERRSPA